MGDDKPLSPPGEGSEESLSGSMPPKPPAVPPPSRKGGPLPPPPQPPSISPPSSKGPVLPPPKLPSSLHLSGSSSRQVPPSGSFSEGMLDPRYQEMIRKVQNVDDTKKRLENKLIEMERRLTEEREKVMMAAMKAKEEESITSRVETSLREIQEKLRREKKEQELGEAKTRAESQLAEIEKRLTQERETWVITLKNQLGQRDLDSKEVEDVFQVRMADLEKRWVEEKGRLEFTLRSKEDQVQKFQQELALRDEKYQLTLTSKEREWALLEEQRTSQISELQKEKAESILQHQQIRHSHEMEEAELAGKLENLETLAALKDEEISRLRVDITNNRARIESEMSVEKSKWEQERSELVTARQGMLSQIGSMQSEVNGLHEKIRQERQSREEIRSALKNQASQDVSRLQEDIRREKAAQDELRSALKAQYEERANALKQGLQTKVEEIDKQKSTHEAERRDMSQLFKQREEEIKQIRQSYEDLERVNHDLEGRILSEKQISESFHSQKNQEILQYKGMLAQQEKSIRERVEAEYNELVKNLTRENELWAEDIRASAETAAADRVKIVRQELSDIKDLVDQELSTLENEESEKRKVVEEHSQMALKLKARARELEDQLSSQASQMKIHVKELEDQLSSERVEWEKIIRGKNKEEKDLQEQIDVMMKKLENYDKRTDELEIERIRLEETLREKEKGEKGIDPEEHTRVVTLLQRHIGQLENSLSMAKSHQEETIQGREQEVTRHYETVGRKLSDRIKELEDSLESVRQNKSVEPSRPKPSSPPMRIPLSGPPSPSLWKRIKEWFDKPVIIVGGQK